MKKLMTCVAVSSFALLAINCVGVESQESEESELDEAVLEETGEAEQAVKIGDYYNPPRCGPRNCVAMCVTCEYDLCRIYGGSIAECNAEKETCKDICYEDTCEGGEPGCPCQYPGDPACW